MLKALSRLAALALLVPSLAFAQGTVQQVGPVVPGHAAVWWGNGQVTDSNSFPSWLSSFLDQNFGTTEGSLLCRGASTWNEISPGGSSQFLEAQASGCPVWATPGTTFSNPLRVIASGTTDTATSTDGTIAWNSATSGAKAEAIYGCTSSVNGRSLILKDQYGNAGTYAITITPASGTVNGASSYTLAVNQQAVQFQCDGTTGDWMVLAPGNLSAAAITTALGYTPPNVASPQTWTGLQTFSGGISVAANGYNGYTPLSPANNLSELSSPTTAVLNLGAAPQVTSIAALSAAATTQYPNGVWLVRKTAPPVFYKPVATAPTITASVVGSASGGNLVITGVNSGTVLPNMMVGLTGARIVSGTLPGGTGTYGLSSTVTISSGAITLAGDGGWEIPSADGFAWHAVLPESVSVKVWQAAQDDTTDDWAPIMAAVNWELHEEGSTLVWGDSNNGGAFKVTKDVIVDIGTSTVNGQSDGLKWQLVGGTDIDGTTITSTPTLEFRCGTTATVPAGCNNVSVQGGRLTVKGSNASGPVVAFGLPSSAGTQDLFNGGTWDYIIPQNFSSATGACGAQINQVHNARMAILATFAANGGGATCNGVEITGAENDILQLTAQWGGNASTANQIVIDGSQPVFGNDIYLIGVNTGAGTGTCLAISDANAANNRFYGSFGGCYNGVNATAGFNNQLIDPYWGTTIPTRFVSSTGVVDTGARASGFFQCTSGGCTIIKATNIASVTRVQQGEYEITFSTGVFSNSQFTFACTPSSATPSIICVDDSGTARTSTTAYVWIYNTSGAALTDANFEITATGNP